MPNSVIINITRIRAGDVCRFEWRPVERFLDSNEWHSPTERTVTVQVASKTPEHAPTCITKSIFFCFIHCGLGSLDVLGWRCESGCSRIARRITDRLLGSDREERIGRAHSSHRNLGYLDRTEGSARRPEDLRVSRARVLVTLSHGS